MLVKIPTKNLTDGWSENNSYRVKELKEQLHNVQQQLDKRNVEMELAYEDHKKWVCTHTTYLVAHGSFYNVYFKGALYDELLTLPKLAALHSQSFVG